MKRISIVVVLMLCFLVGCSSQGTVVDGISVTNEKNTKYTVFDCNGILLGSKDDENTWWELTIKDYDEFKDLQDGEFAYCSLNTNVKTGGIAGIHEITVKKVNSCERCTLNDVKKNKGALFMQYDVKHPSVAGVSYFDNYVIAQIISDSYYVYQDDIFLDKYTDLDEVTVLLQGGINSEEKTETVLDDETKELYKQYESDAITTIIESEEFNSADKETRISMMLDCLETLYENGYIEGYEVPDNDVIAYTDIYGYASGVKVMPFEDDMN